jgi:hypothetical protein
LIGSRDLQILKIRNGQLAPRKNAKAPRSVFVGSNHGNRPMTQLTQSDFRDELRTAKVEPLLPIEKKLIGWSLGIGLFLLAVLAIVSHFFPVAA